MFHSDDVIKTATDISEMIEWYRRNNEKANITELLHAQDQITTLRYTLSTYTAHYKGGYIFSMLKRKLEVERTKRSLIKADYTVNKAEVESKVQAEDLYKDEIDKEEFVIMLESIIRDSKPVIEAIRQRISFLKQEYDETR